MPRMVLLALFIVIFSIVLTGCDRHQDPTPDIKNGQKQESAKNDYISKKQNNTAIKNAEDSQDQITTSSKGKKSEFTNETTSKNITDFRSEKSAATETTIEQNKSNVVVQSQNSVSDEELEDVYNDIDQEIKALINELDGLENEEPGVLNGIEGEEDDQ
ncbi:MAG: hypothetical protein ACM3MK_12995 [Chitinophagales bacterium]